MDSAHSTGGAAQPAVESEVYFLRQVSSDALSLADFLKICLIRAVCIVHKFACSLFQPDAACRLEPPQRTSAWARTQGEFWYGVGYRRYPV